MASISLKVGPYEILETIGVGSFGKVKLAVHSQTRQKVALKFVNRKRIASLDMVLRIRREVQYLKCLRHPHIIKLYEVITTPTDIIMVMEYAGGELFSLIVEKGRLTEDEARAMFQQLISAIEHCHRHKIVHRDLKPENVLMDAKGNVKIADFGLSNLMKDGDFLQTSCGSPNYASPEVITGSLYAGPEVDIWSCGVILFVMLTGKLPFDDENIPILFKKIRAGSFQIPTFLSTEVHQLLLRMIEVDPLKRITIQGIRESPWFKKELPEYLLPLPDLQDSTFDDIDEAILDDLVEKMGLEKSSALESLKSPDNNQVKVAYQLLLDQRQLADSAGRLRTASSGLFSSSPPVWNALTKSFVPSGLSTISNKPSLSPNQTPSPTIRPLSSSLSKNSQLTSSPLASRRKSKSRPKWHYGIRSRSDPLKIMLEMYQALKSCGMEWVTVNAFHITCRFTTPQSVTVNFDVKLYKSDAESYLVDFQNISQPLSVPGKEGDDEGDCTGVYAFFEATTRLVTKLALA